MGSKGATTTTNQQQTYTPTGGADIQAALQKAQGAASQPFNIPQAPVAGFSQDQLSAFQNVNNAQGMAQPYINQAQNYFQQSAQRPDVQSYYNPMAANVTSQLQNIFGQQNSQNTGQLTQAAGGVGADRIAVGQGNLANQQGLAAGQTYANLWQQAQGAAQQQQSALQSAGYGTAALGSQAQNAALQGAQAQLGTGGLQQQLSQAQLNSPYQQQLAQAAFPYQQAQFLAGITGSLAPGLGGTTQGSGSQTTPGPSIWSQILGLGGAAAGAAGGAGAFGNKGNSLSTGSAIPGATGATSVNGAPLNNTTYADGGSVNPFAYAPGGEVSDQPIDVAPSKVIPDEKLSAISPHIPQLNLTPQQSQGGGGSGGGAGDIISMAAKILPMVLANRGGSINPFAGGGGVKFSDLHHSGNIEDRRDEEDPGYSRLGVDLGAPSLDRTAAFKEHPDYNDGVSPPSTLAKQGGVGALVKRLGYADGGSADDSHPPGFDILAKAMNEKLGGAGEASTALRGRGTDMLADAMNDAGYDSANGPNDAIRLDPQATNAWRQGKDAGNAGTTADAAPGAAPALPPPTTVAPAPGDRPAAAPAQSLGSPAPPETDSGKGNDFIKSPWAALMAAGLGIAGGTSPFAGVNIGQGAMQGLKMLEQQRTEGQKDTTIEQAAKRLEQEAKFHEDQYTRATPYQQYEMKKPVPMGQTIGPLGLPMTTYGVPDGKGGFTPVQGSASTDPAENPIMNIAKAIERGEQPPDMTGMTRISPALRSQFAKDGFDLTRASLEYQSAKKQVLSLNGSQTQRLVGLSRSVDNVINEVSSIGEELHNSGVPLLNHAKLAWIMQTEGNTPKGQLAARYIGAVNTLKEEFANAANGGYAPTEPAWKLANEQINGDYGEQQLKASLGEVQRLVRYRVQSIPGMSSLGPGSNNRYMPGDQSVHPQGGAAPAGGAAAPAEAAPKVGDRKQFKQGWGVWNGTAWVPATQ